MEFYMKENGMHTKFGYGELDISSDDTKGFRPFQLMVASIAGCSASVFRKILAKQRIEIAELQIVADVKRDPDEANRIKDITLNFVVKGDRLDQTKMEKNLKLARKNCSMVRSVEDSINITETIETVQLSE
ncbi:MAG TPA: OsmC family protein [Bacillota bacterium]|nr:OsmC family protein [Bacillota bacterium]